MAKPTGAWTGLWCRIGVVVVGLLLATMPVLAGDPWPDAVVSVSYGPTAGFGQEFVPDNILGPPDPLATPTAPANTPEELLALGTGGEIVLRFDDGGIVDGPGPDVTVFENAFLVGGGGAVFTEAAIVAVSEDGATWHEFPWTADPPAGLAGLTPTDGAADPTDPAVSGGDSFDLADLGLAGPVTYLRIRDAGDAVPDSGVSFDLDAVAVIHGEDGTAVPDADEGWSDRPNTDRRPASQEETLRVSVWPNPFNSQITVMFGDEAGSPVTVYDLMGRTVANFDVPRGRVVWNANGMPSGTYLLRVETPAGPLTQRVVKLR